MTLSRQRGRGSISNCARKLAIWGSNTAAKTIAVNLSPFRFQQAMVQAQRRNSLAYTLIGFKESKQYQEERPNMWPRSIWIVALLCSLCVGEAVALLLLATKKGSLGLQTCVAEVKTNRCSRAKQHMLMNFKEQDTYDRVLGRPPVSQAVH